MKKIFILLLLIAPFLLTAQSRRADKKRAKNLKESKAYYDEIFKDRAKDFEVTSAPAEWKDEPLVILSQKVHLSFLREMGMNDNAYTKTKGIIRKRVLIQDKSELETLSEFYYQESEAMGITHVKKNGEEIKINLKNAVSVETEVPDFYKDDFHSEKYYKIAIPDIEVGDIIDYFKVFTESYANDIKFVSPILGSYPILSQEIILDVDKGWTLYANSFNGAAEFKLDEAGGKDIKGRKRKSIKRYVLKDEKRAAMDLERFSNTYSYLPLIKIMAVHSSSSFYDKKNRIISSLDKDETFKKIIAESQTISNYTANLFWKKIKKSGINDLSQKEKVEDVYNALRFHSVFTYATRGSFDLGNQSIRSLSREDAFLRTRSDLFATIFCNLLDKADVESEIVMLLPHYLKDETDLISKGELRFGVYVPLTKKYYWELSNYTMAHHESAALLGTRGFKVPYKKINKRKATFKNITVPFSTPAKNTYKVISEVTVKEDNTLDIKQDMALSGMFKNNYNRLFLYHTDYAREDAEVYGDKNLRKKLEKSSSRDGKKKSKKKGKSKRRKSKKNSKEETSKKQSSEYDDIRKDRIEGWIKNNYEVDEVISFKTLEYGIYPTRPELKFEMNFTSKDYLNKAGNNLIFEVGKLIGGQLELENDEMKNRQYKAYFDFEKTLDEEITINLPAGKTAHGLEALNFNVDNAYASFISTAVQEGSTLKISTKKTYKKSEVPPTEWQNYVEMLEAAYQFTQQKIILK